MNANRQERILQLKNKIERLQAELGYLETLEKIEESQLLKYQEITKIDEEKSDKVLGSKKSSDLVTL